MDPLEEEHKKHMKKHMMFGALCRWNFWAELRNFAAGTDGRMDGPRKSVAVKIVGNAKFVSFTIWKVRAPGCCEVI